MNIFGGSDPAFYNDKNAIRAALVSEFKADDLYSTIILLTKDLKVKEKIEHIQKEEQEHIGELLALLLVLEGGDFSSFASALVKGLSMPS